MSETKQEVKISEKDQKILNELEALEKEFHNDIENIRNEAKKNKNRELRK